MPKSPISLIAGALCTLFAVAAPRAAPTSNPNATPEAKALLQYLISLSGHKILSGQESMFSDGSFPSARDKYVFQKAGKYPAVYASDFGDVGSGNVGDRNKVVANAIAYSKKGSIIELQYHMVQPDLADGAGFDAMHIKGSAYTKIGDILTPGSALNAVFNKRLDDLAGFFKTLQDNKVAVLWRPFHEMNGDWFWWSYQEKFKDLWIYTYNYLTNTKQCNNLVWVFSVNWYSQGATGKSSPDYYYPGPAYVDVLGCDVYTNYGHNYGKYVHDDLLKLGENRPIAFTENGPMPDIAALRLEQPMWVYWLTWWGFENSVNGVTMNADAMYAKNYGDESVLTQDEVNLANAVRPAIRASRSGGIKVSYGRSGAVFDAPEGFDRISPYDLRGGTASRNHLSTGAYLLRAIGPAGHLDAKIITE